MRRGIRDIPSFQPARRTARQAAGLAVSFFLLLAHPGTAGAEWVEWIADAEAGLVYEDNLNRSAFANNEKNDTALVPSASFGRVYQITDAARIRVSADFEVSAYDKYDLLNYWKAGASLAARHKIGLGPDVPWVQGRLAAAHMDVRDDMRDSNLYSAGLLAGKRLSERLDARIGDA